jgi:DNA-directed RNA polymerase specialized sigma24 family protein
MKQLLHAWREPPSHEADEPPEAWSRITSEDLATALERLDPPFREVFELHIRNVPLAEMAATLGIPVSTAGTRLFRARKKLRSILTDVDASRRAPIARNTMKARAIDITKEKRTLVRRRAGADAVTTGEP